MKAVAHHPKLHSTTSKLVVFSTLLFFAAGLLPAQAANASAKGRKPAKKAAAVQGEQEEPAQNGPAKNVPIRIERPAEMHERNMSGEYRFYLGSTHSHSVYSGDHAKTVATKFNNGVMTFNMHTPAECYAKARSNFYDFYFVTEHSSPEQNEFYAAAMTDQHWDAEKAQATAESTPGFVAMRGFEFSRNNDKEGGGRGHMNILNSSKWVSAYAPGHTFSWVYDWMGAQKEDLVVAQFNHPQMPGNLQQKNFKNYAGRTKERNEVVRLAEIWNSGESMHYVPVVKKIWSLGWKVAPSAGTDVHGSYGIENRRIRTGVLAESLTTDAIMRAMKARRVYATVEPTLHMEFTLNGEMMGAVLEKAPEGPMKAKVFANDPGGAVITRAEIFGGKYDTHGGTHEKVATVNFAGGAKAGEANVPGGYDFYYAALYKDGVETARAFSAPVWMDDL